MREVDKFGCIDDAKAGNIGGRFNDLRCARGFAAGSDDFLMVPVTDEKNLVALLGIADRFGVDFGHERASCIDGVEAAIASLLAKRGADTVG